MQQWWCVFFMLVRSVVNRVASCIFSGWPLFCGIALVELQLFASGSKLFGRSVSKYLIDRQRVLRVYVKTPSRTAREQDRLALQGHRSGGRDSAGRPAAVFLDRSAKGGIDQGREYVARRRRNMWLGGEVGQVAGYQSQTLTAHERGGLQATELAA